MIDFLYFEENLIVAFLPANFKIKYFNKVFAPHYPVAVLIAVGVLLVEIEVIFLAGLKMVLDGEGPEGP